MPAVKILTAVFAAVSVVACSGAFAQFVPDTPDVISVEQLLQNGKNKDRVALEGRVVKELWHEKYMFEDATGTVKVKIDDKLLYGKPIDSKTKLRIEGKFEREFMETDEVEVKRISILK